MSGQRLRMPLVLFALLLASLAGGSGALAKDAAPDHGLISDAPDAIVAINKPLRGIVLAREGGTVVRVGGAHIGTGLTSVRTDSAGRYLIPAEIRTDHLNVVSAGYEIERRVTTADYVVTYLKPLDVRAIYIPYDELRRTEVMEWTLGLARANLISAVVVDVKDEAGSVLPLAATQQVIDMRAVRGTGTDVEGFLTELAELGVYRIARVVTFLDGRFARAFPADAILTATGSVFVDSIGLAWSNPFSEAARAHNVAIGVEAAKWFEEVQYDYVRLPTDPGVVVRNNATPEARSAAITAFTREAASALHAVGAALSIDTFGQTTVIDHDGGIGQVLEDMAPYLDYYSPMVYPSTWTAGWFGLSYPPSDPFLVVKTSVGLAVQRVAPFETVLVRPWLQDFHDYQSRKLYYSAVEVQAQIDASAEAGGSGFMLWDPSLNYHLSVLEELLTASSR